jgi:Trk K+ transport system NAD-binding subunit
MLIAAIANEKKHRMPDGESMIEVGDTVVVVTTEKLKRLTDILD